MIAGKVCYRVGDYAIVQNNYNKRAVSVVNMISETSVRHVRAPEDDTKWDLERRKTIVINSRLTKLYFLKTFVCRTKGFVRIRIHSYNLENECWKFSYEIFCVGTKCETATLCAAGDRLWVSYDSQVVFARPI